MRGRHFRPMPGGWHHHPPRMLMHRPPYRPLFGWGWGVGGLGCLMGPWLLPLMGFLSILSWLLLIGLLR
jgi:hypothetical protein